MRHVALSLPLLFCACAGAAQAEQWQTADDYPIKALREGREGTTNFRLHIGKDGMIKDCVVTQSSGWDDLDEAACDMMMRRARFRPAKDAQGNRSRTPIQIAWFSEYRDEQNYDWQSATPMANTQELI